MLKGLWTGYGKVKVRRAPSGDVGACWPDRDDTSNGGASSEGFALLPETGYWHAERQRLGSRIPVILSVNTAGTLSNARVASGLQRSYIF